MFNDQNLLFGLLNNDLTTVNQQDSGMEKSEKPDFSLAFCPV